MIASDYVCVSSVIFFLALLFGVFFLLWLGRWDLERLLNVHTRQQPGKRTIFVNFDRGRAEATSLASLLTSGVESIPGPFCSQGEAAPSKFLYK